MSGTSYTWRTIRLFIVIVGKEEPIRKAIVDTDPSQLSSGTYVWDKKGLGGAGAVLLFLEIIVEAGSGKLITQHDSRDGLIRPGQRSSYQRYS